MRRRPERDTLLSLILAVPLALSAVGGFPAPAAAQPPERVEWWLYEAGDLTFVSQVPEDDLRRVAISLGALQRVLAETTTLVPRTSVPIRLFVFRDEGMMSAYRHTYEGAPALLSGAFYPATHADFVTLSARNPAEAAATAGHEVVHAALHTQLPGAPLWLEEGLAELYGSLGLRVVRTECGDADADCPAAGDPAVGPDVQALLAVLGETVPEHVRTLENLAERDEGLRLLELLALRAGSPEYHEFDGQQSFYPRAWALAHFLVLGPPQMRRQAWDFIAARRFASVVEPFEKSFRVTPGALEDLVVAQVTQRGTVRGEAEPVRRVVDVTGSTPPLLGRRLGYDEVLVLLGELLAVQGRYDDADDHFLLALQRNPKNARALGGLGFALERRRDWSSARARYAAAVEAAPDDPLLAYRYGASLLVLGKGTHPSKLAEARHHLRKATMLDPDLSPAWGALLDAHQLSGEAGDLDIVYARLRAARPEVALRLLLHYVRHGKSQSARTLIERVLETDGGEVLEAAERAVDRLEWLQLGRPLAEDLIRPAPSR